MAIIGSNVALITVSGIQGAETVESTMEYYPTVGDGDETALEVCQGWVDANKVKWLALCNFQYNMLEVSCSHKIDGIYYDATIGIYSPGAVVGDVLPPYNTFSLSKIPNNSIREPIAEREVGKGRIAISGVSESDQNAGLITAGALVTAVALADSLLEFDADGAGSTFTMFIQSNQKVGDPVEVFAPVSSVIFNRMGTQLTRKS